MRLDETTPGFRAYGLILVLSSALITVQLFVLIQSEGALQYGYELTPAELLPILVMNQALRYLPWFVLPLLLAEVGTPIVWWFYGRRRGMKVPLSKHRAQLGRWLVAMALAFFPSASMITLGLILRVPGLFGSAAYGIAPIYWAQFGALYNALNAQHARHSTGRSRVPAYALAVLIIVVSAFGDRIGIVVYLLLATVWWLSGRDSNSGQVAEADHGL